MAKAVVKQTDAKQPRFEYNLKADKRELFGRKVKSLRRAGILPANVSGKHIKSFSVQTNADEFNKVFAQTGETGVVGLDVGGSVHPILIHEVHRDPVYDRPLHVDFLEVDLTEKVTATVPIEIVGESPLVQTEEGILVQQMHEVEVEALPTDLPEKIEVDISGLVAVGDQLKVSNLKVSSEVKIKEGDVERIVVSIAEPTKEEVVEAPPVPEGEEGVPAEGEAAPEKEAPAEGGEQLASEEKPQE